MGIYTQQNNLRATSFIFPLIITKMRPSSFEIISWAKLEVSALFQSAQHVRNMSSYKSVNGTNNARPKDSKTNGNFQKKKNKKKKNKTKKNKRFFTPKMNVSHNTRFFLNENNTLGQQNHKNSTFFTVKDTQIWPERGQHFVRLKCLESSPKITNNL